MFKILLTVQTGPLWMNSDLIISQKTNKRIKCYFESPLKYKGTTVIVDIDELYS